jgi:hypothetical protein
VPPLAARAPVIDPVIGFRNGGARGPGFVVAIRESLKEAGYVIGPECGNRLLVHGHYDRLPALAADVVGGDDCRDRLPAKLAGLRGRRRSGSNSVMLKAAIAQAPARMIRLGRSCARRLFGALRWFAPPEVAGDARQ